MKKGRYKEEGTRTRKKLQNWMDRGQKSYQEIFYMSNIEHQLVKYLYICLKTYKCIYIKYVCLSVVMGISLDLLNT